MTASTPSSRRGLFRAAAFASVAALGLAACSGDSDGADGEDSGLGTIRVATSVSNSFIFMPIQAMDRLGTFDDTELTVELIEATTPTINQVMAGGEADVALAGGNSVVAGMEQGVEMTLVASSMSDWDQRIIARPGIASVEDLHGGNLGISGAGSPGHYAVEKMVESMGWEEGADYELTSVGDLQGLSAALTAGTIDMFAWNSQTAFTMEESGDAVVLGEASEYVGDVVLQAFGIMDEYAEENPEEVQAFFEAYFATVEELQADPQLFIDVLVEEWDVNENVAQRLAEEGPLDNISSDGVITDAELEGLVDSAEFTLDGAEIADANYVHWQDLP